jgi:alpha-L-fucosidase 2
MRRFLALALFALSAQAAMVAAVVTKDIEYVRRGDQPLLLDASIPDGPGPFAAVVLVHGGGFAGGNKTMYITPIFAPLTEAKFAWFTIDYRLAPAAQLPAPVDDVLSALQWVHDHASEYRVDPKRIALLGESAGAYLVDYAAIVAPKAIAPAAVVSFYGPHDLTYEHDGETVKSGVAGLTGVRKMDAEGERKLRAVSPYFLVHEGLPPFLLVHGDKDQMVPYEQSPRFCKALQAKGGTCELFTVPGGIHGMGVWEKNPGQWAYKAKVVEWLRKNLR